MNKNTIYLLLFILILGITCLRDSEWAENQYEKALYTSAGLVMTLLPISILAYLSLCAALSAKRGSFLDRDFQLAKDKNNNLSRRGVKKLTELRDVCKLTEEQTDGEAKQSMEVDFQQASQQSTMLGECILENEEKKLELIPLKHVLMTIDTTLISLIPLYQKYTNDFREKRRTLLEDLQTNESQLAAIRYIQLIHEFNILESQLVVSELKAILTQQELSNEEIELSLYQFSQLPESQHEISSHASYVLRSLKKYLEKQSILLYKEFLEVLKYRREVLVSSHFRSILSLSKGQALAESILTIFVEDMIYFKFGIEMEDIAHLLNVYDSDLAVLQLQYEYQDILHKLIIGY